MPRLTPYRSSSHAPRALECVSPWTVRCVCSVCACPRCAIRVWTILVARGSRLECEEVVGLADERGGSWAARCGWVAPAEGASPRRGAISRSVLRVRSRRDRDGRRCGVPHRIAWRGSSSARNARAIGIGEQRDAAVAELFEVLALTRREVLGKQLASRTKTVRCSLGVSPSEARLVPMASKNTIAVTGGSPVSRVTSGGKLAGRDGPQSWNTSVQSERSRMRCRPRLSNRSSSSSPFLRSSTMARLTTTWPPCAVERSRAA